MADLDTLRPEVQKALDDLSYFLTGTHNHDDFYTIRAELRRPAEYEQAAGRLAVEKAEFRQRAEKAEAELAALKARRDGSRHAFLRPNMDRITFLAEDIGPVGEYALVKVEE